MEMKINHKLIKDLCGTVSYKKGDSFYRSNKVTLHQYQEDFCEATICGKEDFHVTIEKSKTGDFQMNCTCPTLANFSKSCQHVAATLLAIYERQQLEKRSFLGNQVEPSTVGTETEAFMSLFQNKPTRTSGHQLYFEERKILPISFTIKPVLIGEDQYLLGVEIQIEKDSVKSIRNFLLAVKQGKLYKYSSVSAYDPNIHCFTNESDEVIQQLLRVMYDEKAFLEATSYNSNQTKSNSTLLIPPSSWKDLIPLLKKAPFVFFKREGQAFQSFRVVDGPPPIQFLFEDTEDSNFQLTIKGFERMSILHFYSAVLYDGKVFQLGGQDCERLYELKQTLTSPNKNHIPIPHEQMNVFLEKTVPDLKRIGKVQLSKRMSQELLKTPLIAKLYLDRLRNRLLVGLEFQYEHVIIQPLEQRESAEPMVMRDLEKEEEILQLMETSGFSKTDGGYFMQNELLEYEFLYHVVPKLQSICQIYATTAVRNRIFKKNAHPKIKVHVNEKERTNWLEFKFEMDGVADKEVKEILAALEVKRKYYRLQNGSLLSLETKEMEEIQRFLHAVPSQEQDFETSLNMPMIQGLKFLDRLEDSNVFQAEHSFQERFNQLLNPGTTLFDVPENLNLILRDYQKQGYQWMKTLASYGFGGILADDMGLGKTIQSIAFITSELVRIRESGQPVLIVCPSSLTYNWLHELAKFAPELQVVVVDGQKLEREQLLKDTSDLDVIITSYPLLRRDIQCFEKQSFHTVFFDEAQAFKNPVTQTARAVKRIKAEHRFGLTGTPVENSLEELWSIFHVVFPQLFQGLKEYSELSRKKIARRVRPFLLRRVKEDVLHELPDKVESLVSAELLPEQKKLYVAYLAKLRHETLKHLDKETVRKNRIKILAGLTRLRQICCHPALFVDGYKGSSAKFEQLLQILEESKLSGRRVLIFSQFTKMLDLIGRELTIRGQTYFYLDGQTASEERLELCNKFNEGESELFLISLKAGGTGLNLTGADTVILYDLWWNPAVEQQAADRAHRMGQQKEVEVIKLIARGTIEEKMNDLQQKKRELIAEIVNSEEQPSNGLTEEDIREILM
ncbi:DEAD/DEAH box helicase [Halalkalibacter akibai]|uniref:DNA/RNA helicases n=1 Tax=Halalkalibacter akibai (strain ATCC 43226 / DSM 21942 / CIP 109018 / JCM 9157 / 1139) TaxID=1236973 RepID=W4QQ31_HALA3|nr:DEAD/DEAH box helicase [Halalkalibacter akibai]GAE34017.1 DNA/RNA helicases [Halalkalibacter akibai JCM 9157]